MEKYAKIKINNVPVYTEEQPYPFWLCKLDEGTGELWFFGAYLTRKRAEQARSEGEWSWPVIIVERIENES